MLIGERHGASDGGCYADDMEEGEETG
jgi:hypothetical protein